MTLPAAPNSISLSNVNVEFGIAYNSQQTFNNPFVRVTFGDWATPISMSSGRGKSWIPSYPAVYTTVGEASIVVPAGTVAVGIKAWGGGGASGGRGTGGTTNVSGCGGAGGFIWGVFDAVAGETLYFNVGGGGTRGTASALAGEGGGGGGATWMRNYSRVGQPYIFIVGGGGGGGGSGGQTSDTGGPGGGGSSNGVTGLNAGATGSSAGGSAASGGSAGAGGSGANASGSAGGFLTGGQGGSNGAAASAGGTGGGGAGGNNGSSGGGGGGGGSGWYGGGGGGWSANMGGGGGGGGSNYSTAISELYNLTGQTGSLGQASYTYPNFGGPDWSNYGIGGYGVTTSGGSGINGFSGAIALYYFTT